MTNFAPRAPSLVYQLGYILLSLLGLVFVWLGVLEIGDLLSGKKHGIDIFDSLCWTMLFLSLGCGFAFQGVYRVVRIAGIEAGKKLFARQPWYYSRDFSGFTAVINPARHAVYAFLTMPGMFGLTGLLCSEWYYGSSMAWIQKLVTVLMFLSTLIVLLMYSLRLYSFARYGGAEIELSQIPLTPGSSFFVVARVSAEFPRELDAAIELKCTRIHRISALGRRWTKTSSVSKVELPLAKARIADGKYHLVAEMLLPDDAHPEDDTNANDIYRWSLCLSIEPDYDLDIPAPVYCVAKPSEVKYNQHLTKELN